jgi:methionine synthase II (cobalamin-independent)
MRIRGEEVALACSMVGGYPRPHWLHGRVFGSLHEPLYRSTAIRVAYEDAVRLCAQDQERAGLDILADGQTDVWEDKAADMMPLFADADVTVVHLESCHRDYRELDAYRRFPNDKVLGLGFIDVKDTNVETPEKVAGNIKRVLEAEIVPPERLFVMPDCGLGYCSRSVAAGKLRAMGEGVRMAREGL